MWAGFTLQQSIYLFQCLGLCLHLWGFMCYFLFCIQKKQLKECDSWRQLPWMYMHEAVEVFNWKSSYVWINPFKRISGNAVLNLCLDQWFNHWPWIIILWLVYSSASHRMIWWGLSNLCVLLKYFLNSPLEERMEVITMCDAHGLLWKYTQRFLLKFGE